MKKLIIILALSLGIGSAYAQKLKEADVPAAVRESFKKNYPTAKVEKWEKEGDLYEAEFMVGKVEHSVGMNASGNVVETEMEIEVKDLPKSVNDYVTKNMPGKKIKEASKITLADGANHYEAEVDDVDYIFDADGNLLKKESENDKDDKD